MAFLTKNRASILIKALIGVACLALIVQRLHQSYSAENLNSVKEIFTVYNSFLIALAVLLLFLNWGIEVFKWQLFTKELEKFSFSKAWQSVWMGVCVGNLTPGRLGEFAGRVLFFKPEHRAKATTLHFVSGIVQLVVTIIMGCMGLLCFSGMIDAAYFYPILIAEATLLSVFILLLWHVNYVIVWLKKADFLKKFDFTHLEIKRPMLLKMLLLSEIRYIVFSVQFYLLLVACGVQGNLYHIAGAITITYLLLSTIPMISFIEVAIRAFVVVLLFGGLGSNDWKLSIAATLLWLINIVIPSVAGYVFLIRNKFSFDKKQQTA
ncbi:MAG TPA: lysylphosphatidylglycerol synthase domain-containing protein [Bacteroidia bacterium]|nr:lysylphosphatidylglycerol synthase domain-containing protein [Bacteroidia bacterium]